MTDETLIPRALRDLLTAMAQHPADSTVGRLLANHFPGGLDEGARTWLVRRQREASAPLAFILHPGYVWVGPKSAPRCFLDPGYVGLTNFWQILMYWQLSHYVPPAQDLIGAPTGNALKGRLSTAADWLEGPADCPRLGRVLRGTEVGRDGSITLPPGIPEVQLQFPA